MSVHKTKDTFIPSYIPEKQDNFLKLWPWRWDFISALHPKPEQSPDWRTESRYPLSDRMILDGDRLYGVRFGAECQYFMLDIDRGSIYHPHRDRFAVGKMVAALELLGVTDYVAVTSSYRGGLHLYFPIGQPVASWQLAAAVQRCLMKAGFYVEKGILEIFPNVRNFDTEPDQHSSYLAHRLPLQQGSYLLDWDWQLVRTDQTAFCKQWAFCQARNKINRIVLQRLVREANERRHKLSYKARKFLEDLNVDIDSGWTGHGQTNFILGRIALREYVFGHVDRHCAPLTGERLTAAIMQTAVELPGYEEFCRHQPEIWERSAEWARAVENSRYWPYQGKRPDRDESTSKITYTTWNEWQQSRARERLTFAIADMLNRGNLPAATRERFEALTQVYGFSGETLYTHRDLWHPEHLWKTPPAPPSFLDDAGSIALGEHGARSHQKLIAQTGRNTLPEADLKPFWLLELEETERNTPFDEGFSSFYRSDGGSYEPE